MSGIGIKDFWVYLCGYALRDQFRYEKFRDADSDRTGICIVAIGQDNDSEPVVHETRNRGAKPRQRSTVIHELVTADRLQLPTEAVGMGSAAVEFDRRPHQLADRLLKKFVGVQRGIPFRHIQNGREERSAWTQRKIDVCVLLVTSLPQISVCAIGYQIGHRGSAGGGHLERCK